MVVPVLSMGKFAQEIEATS